MKIYKTQQEVEKDIKNGVLNCNYEDVKFERDISIDADIINANDINANDINAHNINAYNINANDINAHNINAYNINANDINADDISYYAFCNVYQNIKCKSIQGRRSTHNQPVCLDGKLTIKDNKKDELLKKAQELIDKANEIKEEANKL